MKQIYVTLLGLLTLYGCSKPEGGSTSEKLTFNFENNALGWIGGFADFYTQDSAIYELSFSHAYLPEPLDQSKGALRLSGSNRSDDLFMFIKKEITGLKPNTTYTLNFDIEIATDAASEAAGIGGAPGESVYVKAGAASTEPLAIYKSEVGQDYIGMNIDKGNQGVGGKEMVIIGDLANGTSEFVYKLKSLKNTTPFAATTSAEGNLWLIIGTDSGFEGITTMYYSEIKIDIAAQ